VPTGKAVDTKARVVGELRKSMSHEEIVAHLHHEVADTARFETGRLISVDAGLSDQPPGWAFFGAVRAVLCDVDYVGALYCGFQGKDRWRLATSAKAVRYLREVFSSATGNPCYRDYGELIYNIYRHGTVHLRAPKRLRNTSASSELLSWTLLGPRSGEGPGKTTPGRYTFQHLQAWRVEPNLTTIPVSVQALYEDFLASVEHFADLIRAEAGQSGVDLRDRWRSVADILSEPEDTNLTW
jgi:hypothetical protein